MKRIINFGLALLAGIWAGCDAQKETRNPIKEVNGKPVYEVPFEQPLEINPDREQEFYFRFKEQPDPEINYVIRAIAMFPSQDEKYTNVDGDNHEITDILIEEKKLSFEAALSHYDENHKETKVGLSPIYISYFNLQQKNPDKDHIVRFESNEKIFFAETLSLNSKEIDGVEYAIRNNRIAHFIVQDEEGYYKLLIRPLQTYPNYPKLKLALYVSEMYRHK